MGFDRRQSLRKGTKRGFLQDAIKKKKDSIVNKPAGQKKLPEKVNSKGSKASQVDRSKSQMNVNGFVDTGDFMGFSEMEDSAFQLAKYLESNDSTIPIFTNEPRKSGSLNQNAFDPIDESALLNGLTIDQLLDMSIKELEMALPSPTPTEMSLAQSIVAGSSKRKMDRAGRSNQDEIGQRDAIRNSKRFRNILSDLTEPIVASEKTKWMRYNQFNTTLHEQRVLTSSAVKEIPNSTAIKDVLPPHLKPQKDVPRMTSYITLTKSNALNQQMDRLFNRPCHNYLKGRYCGRICKWNHILPSAHVISEKLLRLPNDNIVYMYTHFVLQSSTAFVTYFPTLCEIFGQRKMESVLFCAISDCEKRENIPFLKFVFNGLIMTGLSKRDALTKVTNKCSKSRDFYDVFIEIIIETDALYFIDKLKEYYLHGTVSMDSMYKLLQQVIDNPDASLLSLFIDILDKYSVYGIFDVETSKSLLSRVKTLVLGSSSLSQKFNQIVQRMI